MRYSKISAHASRAENRGTYMSNGSQRVKIVGLEVGLKVSLKVG